MLRSTLPLVSSRGVSCPPSLPHPAAPVALKPGPVARENCAAVLPSCHGPVAAGECHMRSDCHRSIVKWRLHKREQSVRYIYVRTDSRWHLNIMPKTAAMQIPWKKLCRNRRRPNCTQPASQAETPRKAHQHQPEIVRRNGTPKLVHARQHGKNIFVRYVLNHTAMYMKGRRAQYWDS